MVSTWMDDRWKPMQLRRLFIHMLNMMNIFSVQGRDLTTECDLSFQINKYAKANVEKGREQIICRSKSYFFNNF